MTHAKIVIVDNVWGVIGSTNFDHSFGRNDEVNVAIADGAVAARVCQDSPATRNDPMRCRSTGGHVDPSASGSW